MSLEPTPSLALPHRARPSSPQDLSHLTRQQLQEQCRWLGLYAGGNKEALMRRLSAALVPGARVAVDWPEQDTFRIGTITRTSNDWCAELPAGARQPVASLFGPMAECLALLACPAQSWHAHLTLAYCPPLHLKRSTFEVRYEDGAAPQVAEHSLGVTTFNLLESEVAASAGTASSSSRPARGPPQSGSFVRRDRAGQQALVWYENEEGRRSAERFLSSSPSVSNAMRTQRQQVHGKLRGRSGASVQGGREASRHPTYRPAAKRSASPPHASPTAEPPARGRCRRRAGPAVRHLLRCAALRALHALQAFCNLRRVRGARGRALLLPLVQAARDQHRQGVCGVAD